MQPALIAPKGVRVAVRSSNEALAVVSLGVTEDLVNHASQVSYEVRNDGNSPIVAYVISWRLSGAPGTDRLYFTSSFDSSILGKPIEPGAVLKDLPNIAAEGQRLRSIESEVSFIELADGTRAGSAPEPFGALVDQNRRRLVSALRAYAATLRELGPAGLAERLSRPFELGTSTATPECSATQSGRLVHLLRLLPREELFEVLRRYDE
jgi:hypothetical protein